MMITSYFIQKKETKQEKCRICRNLKQMLLLLQMRNYWDSSENIISNMKKVFDGFTGS